MPERADAARNRVKILAAAEELFTTHGAAEVTMEDIARAAGVGRGTLYRRYPDRAAIAVALLDEHERRLQERLLRGDPPLGPGAPRPSGWRRSTRRWWNCWSGTRPWCWAPRSATRASRRGRTGSGARTSGSWRRRRALRTPTS